MAIVNFPKEINGIRVVQSTEEVVEALAKGETVCRYDQICRSGDHVCAVS